MTQEPLPAAAATPRRPRRWLRRTALSLVLVGALGAGYLYFAAGPEGDLYGKRSEPIEYVGPVDHAALSDPSRYVTGWVPYFNPGNPVATFTENADLFNSVSGFSFIVDAKGDLRRAATTEHEQRMYDAAATAGVPLWMTVADRGGKGTMAALLHDPARRAAHIEDLVALAVDGGYAGIDIDYEQFAFADARTTWNNTQPDWIAFVKELSTALRAKDKQLSVTVPYLVNGKEDKTSGYWVYSWPQIKDSVAQLRVMAYDFSYTSPGPSAPLDWVERITAYGVKTVGADRFVLGVPAYGRSWITDLTGQGCEKLGHKVGDSVALSAARALEVADKYQAKVTFDKAYAEATYTFSYTAGEGPSDQTTGEAALPDCRVTRTVWVSDAQSVAAKAAVARKAGARISLWSVGLEDPATWAALREQQ